MKPLFTIALLATLSFSAIAAETKTLPQIEPPRELVDANSEFAEGTITRLSSQDVAVFLPWAQNAQKVLSKALVDIETMPIQSQVDHLTGVMQSVVRQSGQKNYQLFMRFALNRGMLLSQELLREADLKEPGTLENALDIQVQAIKIALDVHESDLQYQRRVANGNQATNLDYALFGVKFGSAMLKSIQSVLDASAQFRLLYKTLEMVNWDLSRDAMAIEFADVIVEIYNTLSTMNEHPANNDPQNVAAIRRLNVLVAPVGTVERTILMANEETRRELEERERLERLSIAEREIAQQLKNSGIAAIIEGTFVLINGSNNAELFRNCVAKFPASKADDIYFTFGNREIKTLYNSSSYWDPSTACTMMINGLASLSPLSRNSYKVYGAIESASFTFTGSTMSELLYQCDKTVKTAGIQKADDINVGVNDDLPQRVYNSSSYWNGSGAICSVLLQKVVQLSR